MGSEQGRGLKIASYNRRNGIPSYSYSLQSTLSFIDVQYVKNKQTKYTDPILIIYLYFVQYTNFLLYYLRQKVLVFSFLIAPSPSKSSPLDFTWFRPPRSTLAVK